MKYFLEFHQITIMGLVQILFILQYLIMKNLIIILRGHQFRLIENFLK